MKHSILVVDDEAKITRILKMILENNGYDVLVANNAGEAIEQLGRSTVDLILSDINMPEVDGFTMAEQIKKDVRLAEIPVIFLSAKSDITDKFTGYFVGAAEYITKPFDADELLRRIRRVFEVDQLEKTFKLEAKRPERGACEIACNGGCKIAPATLSRTHDFLTIYDEAIKSIYTTSTRIYDPEAVEQAFAAAHGEASAQYRVLNSLAVTTHGIGNPVCADEQADEISCALCDLLRLYIARVSGIGEAATETEARQGIQILVLETDDVNSDFYDMLLENAGFHTRRVPNADDARALLTQGARFNIVLLDVSSGHIDDHTYDTIDNFVSFIDGARINNPDFRAATLILTDETPKGTDRKYIEAVADRVLVKPFSGSDLISAVVDLLRGGK